MKTCPLKTFLLCCFGVCKRYIPVFNAFCYIAFLAMPIIVEGILVSEEPDPIHTILFCSHIQIVLSAYVALLLGYTLNRKNCAHDFLDDIYQAKPTQLISFLSPVYVIYIGLPWFLFNLSCFYDATKMFCFSSIITVQVYMPPLVFIPFFVAGVALYEVHSKSEPS